MTWKHSSPEEDTAIIKEYRETRAPFVVLLNPVWSEEMGTATPFETVIKCNTAATIMNLWVSSKGPLLLPCKFQLSVLLLFWSASSVYYCRLTWIWLSPGDIWHLQHWSVFRESVSVSVSVFGFGFFGTFSNHQTWSQLWFKWHSNQNREANSDGHFPLSLTGTSGCFPFISVLLQPQKSKIDADNRVQYPPIAPFSAQLRKHQCPSGNPIIVDIV